MEAIELLCKKSNVHTAVVYVYVVAIQKFEVCHHSQVRSALNRATVQAVNMCRKLTTGAVDTHRRGRGAGGEGEGSPSFSAHFRQSLAGR